jgi:hypothetical protein
VNEYLEATVSKMEIVRLEGRRQIKRYDGEGGGEFDQFKELKSVRK